MAALPTTALVIDNNARQSVYGVALAILISYNACLDLGFGYFGSQGNSLVTGAVLFVVPVALFFLGRRQNFHFESADFIFLGLVLTALLSSLINNQSRSDWTKEYLLLVSTFAAYAACRTMTSEDAIPIRSAFERVTAAIVLIGAAFTAAEIFRQWDGPPGKPVVFGFDAAGTHFMFGLGFLIIALVTVDRPRRGRTLLICALIFLPTAIFAAAMVRFTFIAAAGSLVVATILTDAGKRLHVAVVLLAMLLAVIVGLGVRYNSAKLYAAYAVEETVDRKGSATTATSMPSCSLAVNRMNSIAIRKALAKDALYLIPTSGLIGTGLDSFMRFSCIDAHQVHISILQMAVEFGWLGGALFLLLIAFAICKLVPFAKRSGGTRFILCSLVFVSLMSLAHGRISRDNALFVLLGAAVGMAAQGQRAARRQDASQASNNRIRNLLPASVVPIISGDLERGLPSISQSTPN